MSNLTETNAALSDLLALSNKTRFYQTGSRKMAEAAKELQSSINSGSTKHLMPAEMSNVLALAKVSESSDADYDFVTQDDRSVDVENLLEKKGFVKARMEAYLGTDTKAVYVKGDVQVIIKHDVRLYLQVFDNISVTYFANYLWKSAPQSLFKSDVQDSNKEAHRKFIQATLAVMLEQHKIERAARKAEAPF